MNKRMKELAQKAGVSFLMEDDHSMVMNGKDLEIFAELIAQECASKVAGMVMRDKFDTIPQDPHSQGWNEAVDYASKELKKHFGVE